MNLTRSDLGYRRTVVLRLDPESLLWQSAARAAGDHAPEVVRALLAGRRRLELSCDEADATIAWARQVPGWRIGDATALTAYPLDPTRPPTAV